MLKKIIKNLETGAYRIEYREKCECRFDWRLEKDELVCDITSIDGNCWYDNVLIMDDLALSVGNAGIIASYDAYFGLNVTVNVSSVAEQEIVNAIKDSDAYTQLIAGINSPDANNDLHDKRKRDALVKWLEKNVHLNFYTYYPREYANEYVCVLLVLPYYCYKKDSLWVPAYWYSKTAEEWAEMYLRKNTDGAQFDIGFELINEIYEIDYCYYDRHADMTISHDAEKYFFVDLQDAKIFLNTLNPEGIDCYDLDKLTVDYFDGEIDDIDFQQTKWGPEAAKEARKNGNPFVPEPEPDPDPEKEFERYSEEYGVYNWQGIELTLIQDPYLSEDVFGDPCYYATAIDREGNGWSIKWEILPGIDINTHTDAGDHCDWDNPVFAEMDEEEFYLYLI